MVEKRRVLVVDDDVLFAEGLSDILSEKGYEITVVYSGNDVLGKVQEIHFAVILLDIKMPIMNGVETYKTIKKISPQTSVILMTAFSVENIIKDALEEGVYGVVHKPLDIEKIIKMIEGVG